jgi:uncharacterized protein
MNYVVTHHFLKKGITMDMMQPHIKYLMSLFERGKLVMTGPFTDKDGGGMFVLEVDSEEEMNEIVNNDPAILEGLARSEVRPYRKCFTASELSVLLS